MNILLFDINLMHQQVFYLYLIQSSFGMLNILSIPIFCKIKAVTVFAPIKIYY